MNIRSNPNVQATPLAQPKRTPSTSTVSTVKAPPAPGSAPTRSALAPQATRPTAGPALASPEEHKHIEKTIEHSQPQHIQGNAQIMVEQQVALAMQTQAFATRIDAGSKAMSASTQLLTHMTQQQVTQNDFEVHQSISPLETPHQIGSPSENKLRQAEITHGKNEAQRQIQFSAALMMPDPNSTQERMKLASENMKARSGEATERFNIALQADPSKVGELNKHLQAEMKTINLLFQAEQGHPEHLTPLGTGGLGQGNPHRSELLGHTTQAQATIQLEKTNHLTAMVEKENQIAQLQNDLKSTEKQLSELTEQEDIAVNLSIAHEESHSQDLSHSIRERLIPREDIDGRIAHIDKEIASAAKKADSFLSNCIHTLQNDTKMSSIDLKHLMVAKDAISQGKPVNLEQPIFQDGRFDIQNHTPKAKLMSYQGFVGDRQRLLKEKEALLQRDEDRKSVV